MPAIRCTRYKYKSKTIVFVSAFLYFLDSLWLLRLAKAGLPLDWRLNIIKHISCSFAAYNTPCDYFFCRPFFAIPYFTSCLHCIVF